MSNLSTLPKGDSAWLLRKAIERIIDQVSVLETNIGVSTSGNSANTQIIFNDNGTLRGDAGLVYNKTTDALTVGGNVQAASATITGAATVGTTLGVTGVSTLSGNTLNVGAGNSSPVVNFKAADTGSVTLNFGGTTNPDKGRILYSDNSDLFAFYTADTEQMRLNSTGLGIGSVPIAGQRLTVEGGDIYLKSANKLTLDNASNNFGAQIYNIGASAQAALAFMLGATQAMTLNSTGLNVGSSTQYAKLTSTGSNATGIANIQNSAFASNGNSSLSCYIGHDGTANRPFIQAATGNAGSAFSLLINPYGGDVSIGNGNVVMATPGKGIDFSATANSSGTMTSELLNDYEEGTWTGTLKGSVSDPTIPVTATGAYTKVGRLVTVTIRYINVLTTGASGDVTITGLPFSGAENSAGSAVAFNMFTTSTTLACWNNATTIAFYVSGTFTPATHNAGANRSVTVTITYYV